MSALLWRWLMADVPALPPSSWLEDRTLLLGGGALSGLFLVVVVVWFTGRKKSGARQERNHSGTEAAAKTRRPESP